MIGYSEYQDWLGSGAGRRHQETAGTGEHHGRHGMSTETVITLEQLTAQLEKFRGQVIHSGAGLAMTIMNGAAVDADRQKAGTA